MAVFVFSGGERIKEERIRTKLIRLVVYFNGLHVHITDDQAKRSCGPF